jgi:cysteinyl-tRNA synthetase
MNLTDVDDRIIREANARGIPIREFTDPFVAAFQEDRKWLRIEDAEVYPRATDFIEEMQRLVTKLLETGNAYRGDDGSVYFAIQNFPAYGRLSQLDKRELKAGASGRVSTDEYDKENAQDFVLWKAAKPEDEAVGAAWDAPFGRGRPGWHLECSAMALALLHRRGMGQVLDIHAGGVDLIFPHHEDEIAQSCAFTGEEYFARYWLHAEFLNVRGTKMSKRFGNITTPRDLRADGADAGAIRLLLFQTHYRQKMDLTDESFVAAAKGARRLGETVTRLRAYAAGHPEVAGHLADEAARFREILAHELDHDLNAPSAIAAMFDFATIANREMDSGHGGAPRALEAFEWANAIFDVLPASNEGRGGLVVPRLHSEAHGEVTTPVSESPPTDPGLAEEWARQMANARRSAKSRRDYKEADRIRDLLKGAGWEVRDNKDGTAEVRRI